MRGLTAQEGTDAGQEFAHPKRLEHQVITTQIKELDAFIFVTGIAQYNHWRMRELLQRLREFSHAPVIVLSDACDEDERVQLFDLGCDDLMLKPFGMRELLARIRALLRRQSSHVERPQVQTTFTTGDLTIDFAQHQVSVKGSLVQLSRTE